MFTLNQCRRTWRIFMCTNNVNRNLFSGTIVIKKCIARRSIYDSVKTRRTQSPPKLKSITSHHLKDNTITQMNKLRILSEQSSLCLKGSNAKDQHKLPNKVDYCKPAAIPTGDSSSPGNDKTNRLLIGLLALGGAAVTAYYLSSRNSDNDSKGKKGGPYDALGSVPAKVPLNSADLPTEVPYLLIGGGTASFSAFRAIKSHDPKAKVLVVSSEYERPYMRPPLSKELWFHAEKNIIPTDFRFKQWNGAERSLYYEPAEFYIDPTKLMENENGGVAIAQGYTVKKIDVCDRKAILSDGTEITYGECLIATGCTPKNLAVFQATQANVREHITVFRNTQDFINLKRIAETKKSIAVIGSGFLGSELSCALSKFSGGTGMKVYQVFHESGNMAKVLPEYLSKWATKKVQDQGVSVIPKSEVEEVTCQNSQVMLKLNSGEALLVDHVVVCVGCDANTDIAEISGLETDSKLGGFVVNAELEARRHLYVAGDAACFYDPLLGRRRVEHHDHSVVSGRLAGENMTGAKKPYKHQSMFWSDLGPEVGFEGIGLVDSSLPTVGVFAKRSSGDDDVRSIENGKTEENEKRFIESQKIDSDLDQYDKGVIFYLKDDKIVGILLWNIFNRINIARKVINENKRFSDLNEVAKLFDIHS